MHQLYAGDILPLKAWEILKEDSQAVLVDVRTMAEWHYVGLPDLRPIGKSVIRLEWRSLPDMSLNVNFAEELNSVVPKKENTILLLCRTGGRSMEAAMCLTRFGYETCYNIAYGFEGDADLSSHRGKVNGWKAEKLPWRQD